MWQAIEPLPLTMHLPTFGKEPSERTEIRITYDDDNLYVVTRNFTAEHDRVQRNSMTRDVWSARCEGSRVCDVRGRIAATCVCLWITARSSRRYRCQRRGMVGALTLMAQIPKVKGVESPQKLRWRNPCNAGKVFA